MNALLDTHAFVWWANDEEDEIGSAAQTIIRSAVNRIYVSAASLYEIVLKHQLGKWSEIDPIARDPVAAATISGFDIIPISADDAVAAARLSLVHRDPFDRIIAAQAMARNLV